MLLEKLNLLYLLLSAMAAIFGFSVYLKFIILKPCSQVMDHVKFEIIAAEVSEKHLFSKLFSNVDRQWPMKDNQPTLDALI